MPGVSKKLERGREGVSNKEEAVRRKGIAYVTSPPPPTAYFLHSHSFPPVSERLEKEWKRLLCRLKGY